MSYTMWSWGNNYFGNLGDNSTLNRSSPVQVVGATSDWVQVAGAMRGDDSGDNNKRRCTLGGIKSDGTLWLFGFNDHGELGVGTGSKSSPVQILGGGTNWSHISLGKGYGLGVKTDGSLWSWGDNAYGEFGNNTTVSNTSPENTNTGTTWDKVYTGYHSCGIKTDNTLWTWGQNYYGMLGDDTNVDKSSPVQIFGSWLTASVGILFMGGIKTNGTLWMWGHNNCGQIGDDTINSSSSPIQIGLDTTWSYLSCGETHTAAIKNDGSLWLWGNNGIGELGDNTSETKSSPVQVYNGGTWLDVSCSQDNTVAVKDGGTVWSWGVNPNGECGIGNTNSPVISSPVQIIAYGGWTGVASSQNCGFGLRGTIPTTTSTTTTTPFPTTSTTTTTPSASTYGIHLTNDLIRSYNIATGKNLITEGSDGSLDGTLINGNSSQRSAYLTYANASGEVKVIEAKDGETVDFTIEKFGGNNVVDSV